MIEKDLVGADESSASIVDMNTILEQSIVVRWKDKKFRLDPLSLEDFLKLANQYELMHKRCAEGDVSSEELITSYFNLFHILTPDITRENVGDMSIAECSAFMAIVIDKLAGKIHADNPVHASQFEKKKHQ